ncbi:Ger(x)C family spore germination protein [Bacillus sp. V59.32b]|uniref:Ger(x)C family spore germination protein n=1 Tax=Bacillus sp. V59.32b TaxID=1758642 RepID=UPI000E3C5413|nr:Ger(x)C family spore germination protein [Bacillus sp. V59.32b]RFU69824.1 Ger(x)C family spore germination protein [Bacillus sp. V59.32b]
MKKNPLIYLLFCAMLTGCGVKDNILEDNLLAEVTAYDLAGDDKVKGATLVSVPSSGEKAPMGKEVYSAVAHTGKNIRQKMESETPKRLVGGRLSAVIYGEELAGRGIYDYVDTYRRDPSVGRDIYLAVASGKAEDIVNLESKMTQTPGIKTQELIEQNFQTNLPHTNLHSFLNRYYGDNMDPVMPLLEVKGEHLKLKGIALFRDDKYIGKHISYEDGFLFKVLSGRFKNGVYEIKMKEDSYLNIQNVYSRVKYEINDGNGSPEVFIKVKIRGGLLEVHDLDLKDRSTIPRIEKKAQQIIEKKLYGMVRMFQGNNVDPLALGDRARSQTRHFDKKHWEDEYQTVPIEIKVELKLVQEGITE